MRYFTLTLVLTLSLALDLAAQNWGASEEETLRMKVGQFDSFIKRFNFQEGPTGERVDETTDIAFKGMKVDRVVMVKSLLHESLVASAEELCVQFLDEAVSKPLNISFFDSEWYAWHPAKVSFQGKEQKAVFTMQLESHGQDGAKWVICGLDAPFLAPPSKHDRDRLIPPNSNGTRFIALGPALEDRDHIAEYLPKDFDPDPLTLLMVETVHSPGLRYLHGLDGMEYHLLQMPGWVAVVRFFVREERNHGWLIADLMRMSDAEKREYRREVLNIRTER